MTQPTQRKKERPGISRSRNEQGNITTVTKEIQISIRGYTKNPYSIELENTQEVDEFLCSSKLPKLSQEEINNLNRVVTEEEVETVMKCLLAQMNPQWILPDVQRGSVSNTS